MKRKLEQMTETNKALAPRDIYEQMVLDGSDCGPRDLKQVQNAKYNNKKQKTNNKLYHHQNIADIKLQTKLPSKTSKRCRRCPLFTECYIKMEEKIRSNVLGARQDNKWIPTDWKNNSCESMNHIIKLSSNWTTMKLPALIDRLYRIVKLQKTDCRRALYGEGNYELVPWMRKHKVSSMHWKLGAKNAKHCKKTWTKKESAKYKNKDKTLIKISFKCMSSH